MSLKIILGVERALEDAAAISRELSLECIEMTLDTADRYNFDISKLKNKYPASEYEVFVALDERAVNYARLKLIADIRLAGYRSFNLVSPRAIVEAEVRLTGNIYVGPGCNVGPGCVLGMGSWLERQVTLERNVKLGSCVTLRSAVVLGEGVSIGSGTTLGMQTYAAAGSAIGKHCEWLLGGQVPTSLADGTFFDAIMPAGARVFYYKSTAES